MKRFTLTTILLVSTASSLACTTPLLNEWVNDRGYQFHRDYSSIDTLGWVVQEPGVLAPSQMLKVVDRERGELYCPG